MSTLAAEAMKLSQSFRELATLHEGADRSEILMMQRMSDAMGSVAGELGLSFKQYQKMVADESTDQSGTMREQVQVLKTVLDAMAGQVDSGVKTLHSLQAQLGQG
ncbi:MAG TPA: hypothetical protein VFH88_12730 [Candidatus Krumholzibacteria bacterium]|nr:hypothetical protein [Candidatus Krumholzibacteria bacterium]